MALPHASVPCYANVIRYDQDWEWLALPYHRVSGTPFIVVSYEQSKYKSIPGRQGRGWSRWNVCAAVPVALMVAGDTSQHSYLRGTTPSYFTWSGMITVVPVPLGYTVGSLKEAKQFAEYLWSHSQRNQHEEWVHNMTDPREQAVHRFFQQAPYTHVGTDKVNAMAGNSVWFVPPRTLNKLASQIKQYIDTSTPFLDSRNSELTICTSHFYRFFVQSIIPGAMRSHATVMAWNEFQATL